MNSRFSKSIFAVTAIMSAMFFVGCSSSGFIVIEDAPKGTTQTLGMRTAADLGALSPTTKMVWLELCDKVVKKVGGRGFTETTYVNCEPADHLQAISDKSTSTGFVAGVMGPVMQAGAIAYAGHQIGQGLGRSGSRTTNNNNGGNGNGTASTSQSQGQSSDNANNNANDNMNENNAEGGIGGAGGLGGVGGAGGLGGVGGAGGTSCHGNCK